MLFANGKQTKYTLLYNDIVLFKDTMQNFDFQFQQCSGVYRQLFHLIVQYAIYATSDSNSRSSLTKCFRVLVEYLPRTGVVGYFICALSSVTRSNETYTHSLAHKHKVNEQIPLYTLTILHREDFMMSYHREPKRRKLWIMARLHNYLHPPASKCVCLNTVVQSEINV